ncbi:MAG: hypothetical protein EKK64_03350 [Neisseriaceae bacterium]|nr:MAG: hypothetical protein EKK64_03350 [Neisseriaceae bacterium]
MKKIVFLFSHAHSGSDALYKSLDNTFLIQGFREKKINYLNSSSLIDLTSLPHKRDLRSAVYMDEILTNYSFYLKKDYNKCSFIYLIREPKETLSLMIKKSEKSPEFAVREYCFRLRRICEIARNTPGALFLTFKDLEKEDNIVLIENYLNLKEDLILTEELLSPCRAEKIYIKKELLEKAQTSYEKYLFFIRNQNLIFLNN